MRCDAISEMLCLWYISLPSSAQAHYILRSLNMRGGRINRMGPGGVLFLARNVSQGSARLVMLERARARVDIVYILSILSIVWSWNEGCVLG
jgi:hypothetical protein